MQCPNCSKEIRDTAKVCGYCGHRLQLTPAKCPQCGADVREGAKVCGYCGHKFDTAQKEIKQEPVPSEALQSESAAPPIQKLDHSHEVEQPPEVTNTESPLAPQEQTQPKNAEISQQKPYKSAPASTPEASQEKIKEKKKFPVWLWGIIALIIVGTLAATAIFLTNRLPVQVTEVLPNAKAVTTENFDGNDLSSFRSKNTSLNNGIAKVRGNGQFLENFVIFDSPLSTGDGVLALFMLEPAADGTQWWLLQLYTEKGSDYYASVGFSEWYHPYLDIEGDLTDAPFKGVKTPPKPDVWYYALFAIPKDDEIMVRVWERENPSKLSEYTWQLGKELSGRSWSAGFFAHQGFLYLDSVQIISLPKH